MAYSVEFKFFIFLRIAPDSIILLDCQKGRYDFPELKRLAMEEFESMAQGPQEEVVEEGIASLV